MDTENQEWTALEPQHVYLFAFYTDFEKIARHSDLTHDWAGVLRDEVQHEMDLLAVMQRHGWYFESLTEGSVFLRLRAPVSDLLACLLDLDAEAQNRLFAGLEIFPVEWDPRLDFGAFYLRMEGGVLYANASALLLRYMRNEAAPLPWDLNAVDDSRNVTLLAQNALRDVATRLGFSAVEAEIILSSVANGQEPDAIAEYSGYPVEQVRDILQALRSLRPSHRPYDDNPLDDPEDRTRLLVDELHTALQDGRKKSTLRVGPKVGRNAPCPCGSGKKFKLCCGRT